MNLRTCVALLGLLSGGCEGPQGDQGLQGPAGWDGERGPAGEQGPPGGSPGIVAVVHCTKVVDLIALRYQSAELASGDLFVTCQVSGAASNSSSSSYYWAGQVGAAQGGCIVVFDVDSEATAGWWEFGWRDNRLSADYNDPSSPFAGREVSFSVSECIAHDVAPQGA